MCTNHDHRMNEYDSELDTMREYESECERDYERWNAEKNESTIDTKQEIIEQGPQGAVERAKEAV
ncbi:hypothetical protein BJV78DRAFT_1169432, partial [Lactifluus subvellereus]